MDGTVNVPRLRLPPVCVRGPRFFVFCFSRDVSRRSVGYRGRQCFFGGAGEHLPLLGGPTAAYSTSYRVRLLLRLMRLRTRVAVIFFLVASFPAITISFSLAHAPIGRHMTAPPWCLPVLKSGSWWKTKV